MKKLKLKSSLVAAVIVFSFSAGHAQFNGLINRAKNAARSKVDQKVYQATTLRNVVETVNGMIPEKGDAQGKLECTVGGKDYQLNGKINHQKWSKTQKSTVTFTGVPATLEEFEQVRAVLATEPQGAAVLQIMAFEMYRRDPALGQQALELNNTGTNLRDCIQRLKEMVGDDTGYARPYLAAAMLQGATPENAYTPKFPYEMKVRVSPARKYMDSEILGGTVIYLEIDGKGWDTNWRGLEVVRPDGEDYYVVSNCPAMYTQCKRIKGAYHGLK